MPRRSKHAERPGVARNRSSGTQDVLSVIADSLHQGPAQRLTAAVWLLESCEVRRGRRRLVDRAALRKAMVAARSALKSVRAIIYLLHSVMTEDPDLAAMLQHMIADFRRTTPVRFHLRIRSAKVLANLPLAVAWALGAIAYDRLVNAVIQSNTRRVMVVVSQRRGLATLQIVSDGIACRRRPATLSNSAELGWARNLAEALGGTLETSNDPERGACVKAALPVALDHRRHRARTAHGGRRIGR
ncbi:MAG TPA: hypothetical protein VKT83_10860 [bacterium]|nr:hypothetical protein [bacterium]